MQNLSDVLKCGFGIIGIVFVFVGVHVGFVSYDVVIKVTVENLVGDSDGVNG